jgi:hypothetical protein
MLMLAAFIPACLAYISTLATQLLGEFAVARHVASCQSTDGGAIHVECDATRHHLDVLLLQTGCRAVVTRIGASIAGVDAGLMLSMSHPELLFQPEAE